MTSLVLAHSASLIHMDLICFLFLGMALPPAQKFRSENYDSFLALLLLFPLSRVTQLYPSNPFALQHRFYCLNSSLYDLLSLPHVDSPNNFLADFCLSYLNSPSQIFLNLKCIYLFFALKSFSSTPTLQRIKFRTLSLAYKFHHDLAPI